MCPHGHACASAHPRVLTAVCACTGQRETSSAVLQDSSQSFIFVILKFYFILFSVFEYFAHVWVSCTSRVGVQLWTIVSRPVGAGI